MRSQAVASGTAPDATEPGAVVDDVVEEDLSHLPSYARPTRASLGHVRRGVRASTGSLPTTHRPLSAPKRQQHVRTAAADAATDAVMRRGSSRRSTAGDTARHALESIHEVPAAAAKAPEAAPCKRSALSCTGVKHAAAAKTSRNSRADTAAHRDLVTSHGDQSVRSSMSGRSRGSLPGSKHPSRSTASASTGSRPAGAPAAGSRPSSSRAAPVSAPWSRPSSAASGQGASSTSTSSSSGSGSRAVSAPALDRSGSAAAGTGSTRGAVKGRKSVTPRAAVTSTDLAGTARRVAQPLSKSARSVSSATSVDTEAAPLTAGASAGGAFKGRKASVGAAGASGAGARTNRASVVRASRDSTSSGLQAGVAAAQVAGPAKPSASPWPSISAEPAAATAATAAAVQDAAAAGVGTAALDRVAEADALCAAVTTAANSRSVQTAATTAGPARSAAAAPRSITPDALVPAPGFGTLITSSAIGPTPYGPTPMPPTAFKQGWRPGATPEATPGGLMGHFTALVTPGGACWPQGMPAGGLVPYSITPPDGGRTVARTGAATRSIRGHTPAAIGTSAAGAGTAAARLEQGFAAATESPLESFAAASEGHREGLRTQSARPYRSVTPSAASAAGVSRSSSVRRSMTPTEEGAGLVPGADGPDSSRRSQTPGRTPHSAAKNAALAAQLQNLEQTWGQYKETSGRSSISCSPARARSVPRGSSMRSSIGMTGTRSSLSYSPADQATITASSAAASRNKSPAALVAAMAKSPAGKTAGQSTKQLPQLPGVAIMQELKAAAAAAEAAWYASKSGEEETQEELPACERTDSPAAPAAAGSANAGVSKAPGKSPVVQAAARAGSSGAHLSASKGTVTGSSRPHRYSSGSNATPLSTARPATRGSAGNPGKTPAAAAAAAHATNSAARLTGTKRQTPSRMSAAAVAATPAADGVAANAAPAEGMASGAKWSATAQWAAPSPSASPSFTAKKASKRTGKTPLRHGSAARATKSLTAAADASGGAGATVPFSGFAAAVAEGSPAAASAGAQAGHVVAQSGTPTFAALPATADVPDSPSNIDVSGDIEEVAERLADFSIQQYELQQQQQQRVTSPDAAVGGTGVKTPLESSRQGLHPGPSAVQASWMAFAAGAPGSTSSAGRVKTPPRFRLSGVGVAAGLSGSSHGRGTGGAPMGGGSQAVTPTSAAAAGSSGGSRVQRSIPKAPLAVATTTATAATAAGANAGSSRGSSGATTPTGSESEFYSPLQCTPGSGKSQSHASRLAAEEAAAAAAEPSSVEKLSRKYAALSLIPKAPGTTAVAAAAAVPGPGDAFFTPVEGLVQGSASPGFSSARRQGLATATTAAAAGDDVAVSSASKRRRVAAAAAAAVAAASGGSQADAEAAAAAAAAVVATAQASGGSVGAVRAASQPAKVSKQLLDLFDTAAIEPSVTPPSIPSAAAAAAAAGGAVSRGASSTPGSTGSTGTGSAPRPMRRLSSGAMRTPTVPLSDSPASPTAAAAAGGGASKTTAVSAGVDAPAGVAASRKTPATAGAGKLPAAAGAAAEYAALGARAAFFDVPEVSTPLFPPHTPAATPLKTGFGALSARKLAHIGSGARRVTTAVPASRRKQQQEWGGQEAESAQVPAAAAPKTVVSGAEAAAAAAAALHSRIGKGPAATQPEAAAVAAVTPSAGTTQRAGAGAGAYSIPASANKPMTRRYVAALTPQAAAPAPAAAGSPEAEAPADATAAAVARYNRAGAAAAAAAAGGHPGSGPNGPTDTLAAAAAAAAAGFDVGFRPSPTFKVHSKFPAPAATPAAAGTPGSAGFGSSGIGSPSFATTESDTASTGQGRSGAGGSALKSTAKSGRSANKMFSGGLTKARQLLKAALPKGSSSSKASTKQAAGGGESGASAAAAAVTATGGAGGEAQGVWEVTDSYALSQQQSYDDARGPGFDDQAREVPSCGPFRGASLSKGQFPAAAAAAAGGSGRVRSPPQAAGGAGMLGAWDAADMALPIEAMSDTAYVTTRRRH